MFRLLCVALWLTGCADSPDVPDLPAGWEDAERIAELTQAPCGRSALADDVPEELGWSVGDDGLTVTYDHGHFRCEQDVEGFVRREGDAIDLLVQPIDMDPQAIAACDCLYDISLQLTPPSGDYTLTLYRRWDKHNKPNPTVEIGAAEIAVP